MKDREDVRQVLVFRIGPFSYGLPIDDVKETLPVVHMTEFPESSGLIKGVMNVRGSLLTVMDTRRLLGLEDAPFSSSTRLIVIKRRDRLVGLGADGVPAVMRLSAGQAGAETGTRGVAAGRPEAGAAGGLRSALDLGELVSSEDGTRLIRMLDPNRIFARMEEAGARNGDFKGTREPENAFTGWEADSKQADQERVLVVPFRAAGSDFAISADTVLAVRSLPEQLEPLPGMPSWLLGIAIVQEGLIPVLHAGRMLGDPGRDRPTRVIVMELPLAGKPVTVGLAVERLDRIERVPKALFLELPAILRRAEMDGVTGLYELDGRLTYMLQIDKWQGWTQLAEAIATGSADAAQAEAAAAHQSESAPDELYVIFEVGQVEYGMRAAEVKEILRNPEVTPLPGMPKPVVGITNIRGHMVTVIDLPARLGQRGGAGHQGRMIVAQAGQRRLAFAVDDVRHLRRLGAKDRKRVRAPEPGGAGSPPSASTVSTCTVAEWNPGQLAYLLEGEHLT